MSIIHSETENSTISSLNKIKLDASIGLKNIIASVDKLRGVAMSLPGKFISFSLLQFDKKSSSIRNFLV